MKKCKRCLLENSNAARFCVNCGAELSGEDAADKDVKTGETSNESASTDGSPEKEVFVEAEPVEGATEYSQPDYSQTASDIPNPNPEVKTRAEKGKSCEGILSMAWHDVHTSKGWFSKSALLALIGLIPILNFVVVGYCMRWGRLASFKNAASKPMPPIAINGDYFKIGFFGVLISLCWSVVISIVSSIPYIGIVGAVAGIFAMPMIFMCIQRTNLLNSLASAFELKNIWEKYYRNLGGAMAIAWLPFLLVAAIIVVIVFAIVIVFGISTISIFAGGYLLKALGLVGIVVALAACYIVFMAGAVASLVVYRAFGYWTQRIAPEWIDETYIAAGMTPPAR